LERNAITIAIIITIIVAVLSLTSVPKVNFALKINFTDKYLHAFVYFILSTIWFFALRKKLKKFQFKIFSILNLTLYGALLEILQGGLTNYRTADFYDFLANTLGIIIAALLFNPIHKKLLYNLKKYL